jgi:hypothetical protein
MTSTPHRRSLLAAALALALAVWPAPAGAVQITVDYADGPSEGFNDPTLGAARRAAFEHAMAIWEGALGGSVTVVVEAAMDSLGGSGSSAVLGQAGASTVWRDFTGAPVADTWYPVALANQLYGADLDPGDPDIVATFNGDVDNGTVLGATDWYYGVDGSPGGDIDFVSVVLHEIGHGLGFFDTVSSSTGAWSVGGKPDVYGRNLVYSGSQFPALTNGQRLTAITSDAVSWNGANVVAEEGGTVAIHAPSPYQSGSSISHFSTSLSPNELMEPFYTGAMSEPGLAVEVMLDLGWALGSGTTTTTVTGTTVTTTTGGVASTTTVTTTTTTTTLPPIDPFLCYKAKTTKKTQKFAPVSGVSLKDDFENKTTTLSKPKGFCNPAAANGGPVLDGSTKLGGYALSRTPHKNVELIRVTDAIGWTVVDTLKSDRVLVPSADSTLGPPAAPAPETHDLDDFKCYKVKVPKGSPTPYKGVEVVLSDAFTSTKRFTLKKPRYLCNAVDMNDHGMKNAAAHLFCYKVKPALGEPKHSKQIGLYVANPFLPAHQGDTKKEDLLCMPAVIQVFD